MGTGLQNGGEAVKTPIWRFWPYKVKTAVFFFGAEMVFAIKRTAVVGLLFLQLEDKSLPILLEKA